MKSTKKNSFKAIFTLVFLLSCFSMICPGQETAAPKYMVTVAANLFRSANADYRRVYGQSVFMPEIKITRQVYRDFTIWGSFGSITSNGSIEEVNEKAHIRQTFLSLGAGYAHKLSALLRLRAELGLTSISFKEEALDMTSKGSGLGWKIGANLDYFIGKKMFVTLTTAYSGASDETENGKSELGGFQAGVGLGFAF
jgi:hypothetical protein